MIENFKLMMLNQLLYSNLLLKKYVVQTFLLFHPTCICYLYIFNNNILNHNVGLLDQPAFVIPETH